MTYTYGENGAGPHAVTSLSDDSTFSYDANGNMTTRYDGPTQTTWTYTFDAENRLVAVSDGTTTTAYRYDAGGSRVSRAVTAGASTTETRYVAGVEIELIDGVEDHRTVYYGAGGAFRVIGGDDAGLYFRHTDHLGSTSVISDSTGAAVPGSTVLYAPFGEIRSGTPSEITDFGFTGQRLDSDTGGLMYYGARYYLPNLRRFISADSIIPGMFNSQALNRYSYVYNNPVLFIDPFGHAPTCAQLGEPASCMDDDSQGYYDPGFNPVTPPEYQDIVDGLTDSDSLTDELKGDIVDAVIDFIYHPEDYVDVYVDPLFRQDNEAWTLLSLYAVHSRIGYSAEDLVAHYIYATYGGEVLIDTNYAYQQNQLLSLDGHPTTFATVLSAGVVFYGTADGLLLPGPAGPPTPARNGKGWVFNANGSIPGLHPSIDELRLMDPVRTGPHQYPDGYAVYSRQGQAAHPLTGQTKADACLKIS